MNQLGHPLPPRRAARRRVDFLVTVAAPIAARRGYGRCTPRALRQLLATQRWLTNVSPLVTQLPRTSDLLSLCAGRRFGRGADARAPRIHPTARSNFERGAFEIGNQLVEHYRAGAIRAEYADQRLDVLSTQLRARVGRGYSTMNPSYFRTSRLGYATRSAEIRHIQSGESRAVIALESIRGARKFLRTARRVSQDRAVALGQQTPFDEFSSLALPLRVRALHDGHRGYLPWHRANVFRGPEL